MGDHTLALQANVETVVHDVGSYYRIMSASDAVKIGVDDNPVNKTRNAGVGDFIEGGFKKLRIVSETAQIVTLSIEQGRIDDSRFILTQAGVPIDFNPTQIGNTTWASYVTPVGGFSVGTLVTPAQNTNGIVVTSLNCVAEAGGFMAFVQNAVAPATFADLEGVFCADTYGDAFSGVFAVTLPILIPAGRGLYVCNGTSGNSGTGSFICYTVRS